MLVMVECGSSRCAPIYLKQIKKSTLLLQILKFLMERWFTIDAKDVHLAIMHIYCLIIISHLMVFVFKFCNSTF